MLKIIQKISVKKKGLKPKSFDDLVKEVHDKGICGECGGCVSFCSALDLGAIKMSKKGPPTYINQENCLECGICYLICPQTKELDEELKERFKFHSPIGNWLKISSARASNPEIRKAGTDGGVVTAILISMLEKKLIDGALVSKRIGPFNRVPFLATTKEELIESAGTKIDFAGNITELGQYDTFVPTISKLKLVTNKDLMRIAVVGLPCQIHTIRKMQELGIIPAHIVKYTLGLFCFENFKFNEDSRKKMEKSYNFSFDDIRKMNVKDKLIIELRGKKEPINIEFSELTDIMRHACSVCENFSNVYADISFGGIGSKDGNTSTIVRTQKGREIYNLALKDGYIEEPVGINTPERVSKIFNEIVGMSWMKKKRAENSKLNII